jgi:hypothetical protein
VGEGSSKVASTSLGSVHILSPPASLSLLPLQLLEAAPEALDLQQQEQQVAPVLVPV